MQYKLGPRGFEKVDHLTFKNRGFLYGDGFFETFLLREGLPMFWKEREQRMMRAADYLKINGLSAPDILSALLKLNLVADSTWSRARISVVREEGGKYTPTSNSAEVYLSVESMLETPFNSSEVQQAGVANHRLSIDPANEHKLIAKHHQIILALEAQERGFSDLLVLNDRDELCETISGNLLLLLDDQWVTPHLSSSPLRGVIREILCEHGMVEQQVLKLEDLNEAACIATTNSVIGVGLLNCEGVVGTDEMIEPLQELLTSLALSSIRGLQETQP